MLLRGSVACVCPSSVFLNSIPFPFNLFPLNTHPNLFLFFSSLPRFFFFVFGLFLSRDLARSPKSHFDACDFPSASFPPSLPLPQEGNWFGQDRVSFHCPQPFLFSFFPSARADPPFVCATAVGGVQIAIDREGRATPPARGTNPFRPAPPGEDEEARLYGSPRPPRSRRRPAGPRRSPSMVTVGISRFRHSCVCLR